MAIDAGLAAVVVGLLHPLGGFRPLMGEIHRLERMTVAAFAAVGVLHRFPDVLGKGRPRRLELLRGVDRAEELVPEFVGGLDLANDLGGPVLRHVAIRTSCPHARRILVVYGGLILLVDGVAHLMTGDAEFDAVGRLHCRIETAPGDNSSDRANSADPDQRPGLSPPASVDSTHLRSRRLTGRTLAYGRKPTSRRR